MTFEQILSTINVSQYDDEELVKTYLLNHIRQIRATEGRPKYDIVSTCKQYLTYDHSLIDIANLVKDFATKQFNTQLYITGLNVVTLIHDQNSNFLALINGLRNNSFTDKLKTRFEITFTGSSTQVQQCIDFFNKKFPLTSSITWYYTTKDGTDSVGLHLANHVPIYNEYYPWFEKMTNSHGGYYEGPTDFFKEYLESTAPILFLAGDPGTGKTTFLRAMIHEFNLNILLGYDQKLLDKDDMFIDFLTSANMDMMILEDAETAVYPRKSENNTLISRLLNISDGIIKLPRKKMVFTTNEGFNNVDEALLRPGRCFDSVEFRPLTFDEAVKAAEKANRPIPTQNKSYAISEIFNPTRKVKKTKVGF